MKAKLLLRLSAAAIALSTGEMAASANAAEADDLAALKQEITELRKEYDAKIQSLEQRLKAAESGKTVNAAGAAEAPPLVTIAEPQTVAPPPPEPQAPPQPVARAPVGQNAYNPGIAVSLQGQYAASSRDPDLAAIPGFPLGDEAGLPKRGFSLDESEVALFANVDHRISANLIFSLNDESEVGVEEAYIQTTSLPGGFTIKGGRFFSSIAYINDRHTHDWDFIDAPLPYRAFLGSQLGDDGVQVKWIAPTDFYLEAGAEWLRGDAFPAGGSARKGAGTAAGYVSTGGDIGVSSSWLAKVSYLRTKAEDRGTGVDVFSGRDWLGIASLVYKWSPNGNPAIRNLILSGEYFFGNERGDFNLIPVDQDRSGFYVQGIYQFQKNWRVGLRYARLMTEDVSPALLGSTFDDFGRSPDAISAQLEYDTSEFGRFRILYTYDQSDLKANNEVIARYTVIIGPHGAHRF